MQSAVRTPHSALFAALLFVGLTASAPAAERELLPLEQGRVQVHYHPGDAGLAREAAGTVERASARIAREMGIVFDRPVAVRLARGREEFNRFCGAALPGWALAVALPGRGEIVADAALITPATANDVHVAMVHETVHLALAEAEAGRADRLPQWFHEGVATWFSGGRHFRLDRTAFDAAAARGALIPLESLAAGFPADRAEADLAYLESEAFVAHLAATRSREAVRWILDRYRGGEDFEGAFAEVLGAPRAQMERRWAESLRRRYPWLRALLGSITFWSAMALATLAAFLIVRHRVRRQHKEWENEERLWTVVTDEDEEEAYLPDAGREPWEADDEGGRAP